MLEICPLVALRRGDAVRVDTDPPIAVFHTDNGDLFAIDDTCTHQDASLADGWVEDDQVECPLHASRFDLHTGAVDAPPARDPVRTHRVTVDDVGMIQLEISGAAPTVPPGRAWGGVVLTSLDLPDSLLATLPGSFYTDDTIFALEQEKIFESMWFCVVRSDDLAGPGAFRTVQVGRENLLVSRSRTGEVRAFFNVCRHRGARLTTEESGQVNRNFQCGYHAWTYDLDGRLVAAPNLTKMPDIDRADYGLRRVAVREWLGYIWVCLADDPPPFEDTVQAEVVDRLGTVDRLDRYDVAHLRVGRRIVYDVIANWKLIVENFMECYHCATIHPELTEVLPEFADGYAAQAFVGHGALFGADIAGFTVDGSAGLERIPTLDADQDRRYYAITIKPQVFVNMVPDHVIIHRMFPMAVDRTVVECDWLYPTGVVESGRDVEKSVELFHRVNAQDFEACERTQPSMSSRMYRDGGVLVPSEHHIARFHQWVQARLAG